MTRKITIVRRLNPQVQQVLELMLKHGNEQGYVDWEQLNEKQSGWNDTLPSMRFIQSTAERLRRTGRFEYEKNQRSDASPGTNGASSGPRAGMNTRGGDLLPHNEKLLQLILKYGDKKGYVDYKVLDKEVPNWWSHFKTRNYATVALSSIRKSKRGRAELAKRNASPTRAAALEQPQVAATAVSNGKLEVTPELQALMAEEISKEVRRRVTLIVQDCRYCGRCGKDQGPNLQGAMLLFKP